MVVIEKFDFWLWQWCERMVQHRMLFVQYNCNINMLSFPSFEIFIKIKKRMKILHITCCWSCVETIGNPNFKYLHFHEYLFFLCFLFHIYLHILLFSCWNCCSYVEVFGLILFNKQDCVIFCWCNILSCFFFWLRSWMVRL